MKYERETCNLLRRLGVNNSYVGFRYTVYGVIRAIANPELLIYISKGLYVEISAEYHTSIGCVERNIRTIISTIWLHGDRTLLNQVFGFELEQKPRNGQSGLTTSGPHPCKPGSRTHLTTATAHHP